MRQLTDSEQEALRQARIVWLSQLTVVNKSMSESHKAGFIAALDHSDTQLTALTAERDALAAENKRLKAAQSKAFRYLIGMVKHWRTRASSRYCEVYNRELAHGLNSAADTLEEYIAEARQASGETK